MLMMPVYCFITISILARVKGQALYEQRSLVHNLAVFVVVICSIYHYSVPLNYLWGATLHCHILFYNQITGVILLFSFVLCCSLLFALNLAILKIFHH